jgi:hypothetical protein
LRAVVPALRDCLRGQLYEDTMEGIHDLISEAVEKQNRIDGEQ